MEEVATTPLGRKIAASVPRSDPLLVTPEGALATALARVAQKAMTLPLRTIGHRVISQTSAEIVETLPDHALLAMVEGPKEGLGLAVLDPGALSVLIEMMTLGRLGPQAPAQPRRPTRTDAAMVAGFLDAVLTELDGLLEYDEAITWAGGFRYASHMADPRPLKLILDEPTYRVVHLTLGFGADDSDRQGDVVLILPARGRGAKPRPRAEEGDDGARAANQTAAQNAKNWGAALEEAVMESQTDVTAVLARLVLPLADVLNLEVGTFLPMPMAALRMVQIEGVTGATLCLGSLGQGNGRRAVKIYPVEEGQAAPAGLPEIASELVSSQEQSFTRAPKLSAQAAPSQTGQPTKAADAAADLSKDSVSDHAPDLVPGTATDPAPGTAPEVMPTAMAG
ncbi:MAG: FliM/FliN family flagellar motor switch protein [Albidovulum sp.]